MNTYSELNKRLNELKNGYISKKTINGKERYYLQYRLGNKIISKYIKNDELLNIEKELRERKEIEEKLKLLNSSFKPLRAIGTNAINLTGYVMEEDDVVATFKKNELVDIDKQRAPSIFLKTPYLSPWLEKRSIDTHRTNSRMLKKILRIKNDNDLECVLRVNAASITDNFWFKPLGSKLKYQDVIYDNDFYSDVSLNGDINSAPNNPLMTPELINTGSFEKCWKLIDNQWYMLKKGNKKEILAELFSSKLAEKLNIPTINYNLFENNVISKNFADKINLEPISFFAGEDDSYENVYNAIKQINKDFIKPYLLLMWFDALIDNVDRHNENISIIRERKTGKIISLAPNYDNNLALYSLNENENINSFGLIKAFEKFVLNNKEVLSYCKDIDFPKLNKEMLNDILISIDKNYQIKEIVDFIYNRYLELNNFKQQINNQ